MANVRIAEETDKDKFYKLWQTCFGDSNAFCDWFFENRFSSEHSVVLEEDNEIVSCMQAFPYMILIRNKQVPGAMLCGVSTHPEHRKKGYMGHIFSFEMEHLKNMKYVVAPHTPAVLPSYFSFGHLPAADANYLTCDCVPTMDNVTDLIQVSQKDWNQLHHIYKRFTKKYSGIVDRTEEDFLRKAADYAADGGKCAAYQKDNEIKGYAFYYQTEDTLLCVETVAEAGYYHNLMRGLFSRAEGLKFSAKLPPDLFLSFPFAKMKKMQKGVMGLCNASALLKNLDLNIPYGFKLIDPVIMENNACFDFKGNLYSQPPVFEISAGLLLQVLIGYHTLEELKNNIRIFDNEKFSKINSLLPKQKCYIIDEY